MGKLYFKMKMMPVTDLLLWRHNNSVIDEEKRLLEGARRFDLDCLAAIYDRYSDGLYGYVVRLLGNADLAEECVSETFARFLQALHNGGGPRNHLKAYLYRIAHNWVTDQFRRQPTTMELSENLGGDENDDADGALQLEQEKQRLRAALQALTPDQRQVILLRFFEGWENDQIAAAVEKPVGAVKALQHRAVASLRRWLGEDEREWKHGEE
ncbi:RNA polymerase sigma factor, sigma-70 family [Bellilinea caldifistulae]|nr:RNA polymerase sigma factor [Bellilinea caldifistulae]GAP09487.1 RNA polymerase sigma factor, sigma-70 family [Bellilinea caldifistulae]